MNNTQFLFLKKLLSVARRVGLYELAHNKEFTAKFTFGSAAGAKVKTWATYCSQPPHLPILIHSMLLRASLKSACTFMHAGKQAASQARERHSVWPCLSALAE